MTASNTKLKRVLVLVIILLSMVLILFNAEARAILAKFMLRYSAKEILTELIRNTSHASAIIADFYRDGRRRYPTLQELEKSDSKSDPVAAIWQEYRKNRFSEENCYYYGYERGTCTFMAEGTIKGSLLDIESRDMISKALTHMENEWIINNKSNSNASGMLPRTLMYGSTVVSSPCFQLIKNIDYEEYARIRNELLRLRSETGNCTRICVFSKPFQQRLTQQQDSEIMEKDNPL